MLKQFIAILIVLGAVIPACAKDDKKKSDIDLVTWANEQTSKLPDEVDGVHIYRVNGFDTDGKARVSGFVDMPGLSKEKAFQAAYISVADNMDTETDAIEAVDFGAKKFVVTRVIADGEGKNAATYAFSTAFSFDDGLMNFVTYDINIGFKEKGLISRKMQIEKMNPAAKERHMQLVEGFAFASSKMIDDILKNAEENASLNVTHWDDIKAGNVVKGMNQAEVTLVGGKPRSVTKSGNRVQWIFTNDFIVIFNDGIVTNVMQ
ncbi:MAG: hypothetical protein NC102_09100 [Clostridium sp.]|nr:hypothetical protein [Clostridium sp.]